MVRKLDIPDVFAALRSSSGLRFLFSSALPFLCSSALSLLSSSASALRAFFPRSPREVQSPRLPVSESVT